MPAGSGVFRPESYPHSGRFRQRRHRRTDAGGFRSWSGSLSSTTGQPVAGYLQAKARSVTTLARMLKLNLTPVSDREPVVVNAYEAMALKRKNTESN